MFRPYEWKNDMLQQSYVLKYNFSYHWMKERWSQKVYKAFGLFDLYLYLSVSSYVRLS